jgi:hypothetical protein
MLPMASRDEQIRKVRESIDASLEKGFRVGGLVEFAACSGTYFEIVGGESPFWDLKHFAGPALPKNYHETCFNEDGRMVIETVLMQPNAMEVLATVSRDDE